MKISKRNRNRLLFIASRLDRMAQRIRRYVREHTPKRAAAERKPVDDRQQDAFAEERGA